MLMIPEDKQKEIQELYMKSQAIRGELTTLLESCAAGDVSDYELLDVEGNKLMLSSLADGNGDLIVIQNMGMSCPYCTMWGDGLNGLVDHMENRTALVMITPDSPEVMQKFALSRGWKFRMLSSEGSAFKEDTGFGDGLGNYMPGICSFKVNDGKITHTGMEYFGPGDVYCGAWHVFNMLKDPDNQWQPKLDY